MRKITVLMFAVSLLLTTQLLSQSLLEKADSLWEKRGENFDQQTLLADSAYINQAIQGYKQLIQTADGAEKEEAIWKLIRAYYFKGKHTTHDKEMKKAIYDLGKELGEQGLQQFPDSPGINLFLAIVWGVWGEEYGILAAARKGVAGKIKDLCEKTIELDPEFDEGGGYRVLGRVYFKAPKIWPILRWPSKEKSVEILEKSLEISPKNLNTRQFLAEAFYSQGEKEQAIQMMNEILAEDQMIEGVAEDAVIKSEVREMLADWQK
ncbi:MAG TPA: tetratricopeptide repeat protein [bacterium]|nr:tetratricopeptide repeat protein [bacterium]